jgi:hypothetical protein
VAACVQTVPAGVGADRIRARTWLIAIVVAGAALRLALLFEPMRYDEAFTLDHYAIHSFGFIASTYDFPNNHILYTLLAHTTWLLVGDHVWTVRVPALLAGVALIPATFLAARACYNAVAGLCAAALAATFAPLVDYSVDGRGYTLGILFVVLLVPLAAELRRGERPRLWAGFVACSVLAVYTVPTMAYGVATVVLWLVANTLLDRDADRRRFLVRLVGSVALAAAIALLLYAPVLGQQGWTVVPGLSRSWSHLHALAQATWGDWNRAAPAPLRWLIMLAVIVGLGAHRRIGRERVPVLGAAVVVVIAVLLIGRLSPFARTWLYLAPFYLMTAAGGIVWIAGGAARRFAVPSRAIAAAGALAVAGVMAVVLITGGEHGADGAPMTDNALVSFIRSHLGRGGTLALDAYMSVPAGYYFRVHHYNPPMYTATASGTALVVLVGRRPVRAASALLERLGQSHVTVTHPRLLAHLDYVSAFRAQVTPGG